MPRSRSPRRVRVIVPETLEPRLLLAVSAEEQFFVYRLNRARHDPVAYQQEAELPVSLADVAARPPLAWNETLGDSSGFKAEEMAEYAYFGHRSQATSVWPNQLLRDHGYPLPRTLEVGGVYYAFPDSGNSVESLVAGYSSVEDAMDGLIIDAGIQPPGHREHLLGISPLAAAAREIGVGRAQDDGSPYGTYWAVHLTASDTSQSFLTGVVHKDTNGNQRFDPGEGLPGVTITVGTWQTVTNEAGGWSLPVPAGQYLVSAEGGEFQQRSQVPVTVIDQNVQVDFASGEMGGYVNFELRRHTVPWQNPHDPLDVNNDTVVAPNDALILINALHSDGSRALPPPPVGDYRPPPYLDVSGDDRLAPNDALLVINFLNRTNEDKGEAEGNARTPEYGFAPGPWPLDSSWPPDSSWPLDASWLDRLGELPTSRRDTRHHVRARDAALALWCLPAVDSSRIR